MARVAVGLAAAGLTTWLGWSQLDKYIQEEAGPTLLSSCLEELIKPALDPEFGDEAMNNVRIPACLPCRYFSTLSFVLIYGSMFLAVFSCELFHGYLRRLPWQQGYD